METANQETLERKTMANLPKLKVEGLGWEESKGICEFDQARFFPYHQGDLVIVAE